MAFRLNGTSNPHKNVVITRLKLFKRIGNLIPESLTILKYFCSQRSYKSLNSPFHDHNKYISNKYINTIHATQFKKMTRKVGLTCWFG